MNNKSGLEANFYISRQGSWCGSLCSRQQFVTQDSIPDDFFVIISQTCCHSIPGFFKKHPQTTLNKEFFARLVR
jgi:hypothetical protein